MRSLPLSCPSRFAAFLAAAVLSLAACSKAQEAPPQSRLVVVEHAQPLTSEAGEVFPGAVHSQEEADLSFRIAGKILTRKVDDWLSMLQPADIWCAKVLDYDQLMRETGYKMLNMELKVRTSNGLSIKTTRCPIRIDGQVVFSEMGAPLLGEHNERIDVEFGLIS